MKRIVVITLPIMVTISLVFALLGKNHFDFRATLEMIGTWEFVNPFAAFEKVANTYESVGSTLQSIRESANPIDAIVKLFTAYVNTMRGVGQLIMSTAEMLIGAVKNIGTIYYWLFLEH